MQSEMGPYPCQMPRIGCSDPSTRDKCHIFALSLLSFSWLFDSFGLLFLRNCSKILAETDSVGALHWTDASDFRVRMSTFQHPDARLVIFARNILLPLRFSEINCRAGCLLLAGSLLPDRHCFGSISCNL